MMINLFQKIGESVNSTVDLVVNELQKGWIADLTSLANVSISLYVIVYGYMVLAGKIQTPIPDLLWNLGRFAIVLIFMTNAGGYLTLANGAIEGLKDFFAGGENSFALLDNKVNGLANLAGEIWNKASGLKDTIYSVFRLVGLLPLILGFTAIGALLIFTEITLKLLISTAPIFIFALMWGFLRDSFNNWLSAIIGNCLIILFANVIMKFSFLLVETVLLGTQNEKGFIMSLVFLVVAGLLNIMTVKWGREMALSIGRVSVDGTIGGSASNYSASKQAYSASKKGIEYIKNKKK